MPDGVHVQELLDALMECENFLLATYTEPVKVMEKVRRFMGMRTLGTMEHMKAKLLTRFQHSEEVFLIGADRNRIQTFWIPCREHSINNNYSCATVTLCGQNASFAETLSVNSHLVDFYHQRNVNVVAFNYRGYSQSEGTPTIANLKKDALVVAQFARLQSGKDVKMAAHGISLGGACASHIARKGLVDFVVCDRTFGNLETVPRWSMGKWAQIGLKILLEWSTDSGLDYYYASCYKVIA